MWSFRTFLTALVLLMTLVSYQNCSDYSFNDSKLIASSQGQMDNGQPYDGITYVARGLCSGGATIQARIRYQSGMYFLNRHNCEDIAAVPIPANEIQVLSPAQITYQSLTFDIEMPAPLTARSSYYMQMQGGLVNNAAQVVDVDVFNTSSAQITALRQLNKRVVCNIPAGISETYRPDATSFAAADLGNAIGSDQRWVNVRSTAVRSLMVARLDLAKSKGCEAVNLDNLDGFENNSGFAISRAEQLDYNRFLAAAARQRGLLAGISGAASLAVDLAANFDYAVAVQCFQFNECPSYSSFVNSGKLVVAIEYSGFSAANCTQAANLGLTLTYLNSNLDGTRYQTCP